MYALFSVDLFLPTIMLETSHMLMKMLDVDLSLKFHSFLENKDVTEGCFGPRFELFGSRYLSVWDITPFSNITPFKADIGNFKVKVRKFGCFHFAFEIRECSGSSGLVSSYIAYALRYLQSYCHHRCHIPPTSPTPTTLEALAAAAAKNPKIKVHMDIPRPRTT